MNAVRIVFVALTVFLSPHFVWAEPTWGIDFVEMKPSKGTPGKVTVVRLLETSLAERTGLLAGDNLVSINGQKILSDAEFSAALAKIIDEAKKAEKAIPVTFVVTRRPTAGLGPIRAYSEMTQRERFAKDRGAYAAQRPFPNPTKGEGATDKMPWVETSLKFTIKKVPMKSDTFLIGRPDLKK